MPFLPGLRPFSTPGYWRLWVNGITGALGFNTTNLGLGWLVLELTDSPGLVGALAVVTGSTVVALSPLGGTLADRFDRRGLLIGSQILQGAAYLSIALLAATGLVQYWHLLLTALAMGSARSVMMPTRGALTYDLVGRRAILNAETLQFLAINVGSTLGPLAGGFVLAAWGADALFFGMSVVYLGGMLLLFGMPSPPVARHFSGSPWRDLAAGIAFVVRDRPMRIVAWIVLGTEVLGFCIVIILPIAVRDLLQEDAGVLGVLASGFGLGGLVTAVTLVAIGDVGRRAWLLMGAAFGMGLSIVLFSFSRSLPLSIALIFLTGLTGTAYDVMTGTLFQTLAPSEVRGRVLGVRSTLMSGSNLGAGLVGGAAERIGVGLALALAGSVVALNALRILPMAATVTRRSHGEDPVSQGSV